MLKFLYLTWCVLKHTSYTELLRVKTEMVKNPSWNAKVLFQHTELKEIHRNDSEHLRTLVLKSIIN